MTTEANCLSAGLGSTRSSTPDSFVIPADTLSVEINEDLGNNNELLLAIRNATRNHHVVDGNSMDTFDELLDQEDYEEFFEGQILSEQQLKLRFLREKFLREKLEYELSLERQTRIELQKQLQSFMNCSLQRQFEDSETIKRLRAELFKYKQKLQMPGQPTADGKDEVANNKEVKVLRSADGQLKCQKCGAFFKSEVAILLHLINHEVAGKLSLGTSTFDFKNPPKDKVSTYRCPLCNLYFNVVSIYSHLYSCHTKEKPLVCTECNIFCVHLDDLKEHQQKTHEGAVLKVAQATTLNGAKVDVDIRQEAERNPDTSHHGNRKRKKKCKNAKPYNTRLRKRILESSSSVKEQTEPSITFSNDDENGDETEEEETKEADAEESFCVVEDTSNMSEKNKNIFKCNFKDCDFFTSSQEKLNFHTSAHKNTKFKCPYCPYVGNVLSDIHRHIQKSKKHEGLKIFDCQRCDFGSNCLATFKEHLIKHFGKNEKKIEEHINRMFKNEHNR